VFSGKSGDPVSDGPTRSVVKVQNGLRRLTTKKEKTLPSMENERGLPKNDETQEWMMQDLRN